MESCFASVTLDDLSFLKNQASVYSSMIPYVIIKLMILISLLFVNLNFFQIYFTKELDSSFTYSVEAGNDMTVIVIPNILHP